MFKAVLQKETKTITLRSTFDNINTENRAHRLDAFWRSIYVLWICKKLSEYWCCAIYIAWKPDVRLIKSLFTETLCKPATIFRANLRISDYSTKICSLRVCFSPIFGVFCLAPSPLPAPCSSRSLFMSSNLNTSRHQPTVCWFSASTDQSHALVILYTPRTPPYPTPISCSMSFVSEAAINWVWYENCIESFM